MDSMNPECLVMELNATTVDRPEVALEKEKELMYQIRQLGFECGITTEIRRLAKTEKQFTVTVRGRRCR
jgi:hypothetical protein